MSYKCESEHPRKCQIDNCTEDHCDGLQEGWGLYCQSLCEDHQDQWENSQQKQEAERMADELLEEAFKEWKASV